MNVFFVWIIIGYSLQCYGSHTGLLRDGDDTQKYKSMEGTTPLQPAALDRPLIKSSKHNKSTANDFDECIWDRVMSSELMDFEDIKNLRLGGNHKINEAFKQKFIENTLKFQENLQRMTMSKRGCTEEWLIKRRLNKIPFSMSIGKFHRS